MSVTDPAREPDEIEGVPAPEAQGRVVGHTEILDRLTAWRSAGRMPSAILLHGPRGIGKATLAFAIARDLIAHSGDESADRVSEQIAAGSHPNLFVLRIGRKDKGSGFYTVIRVDEIRDLTARLRRTRGRAGFRVCVVDAIDDCNASAANALLKILEEPPSETVFILVSHRPGSLLPTIRSRCHAQAVRPIADDDVRVLLEAMAPDADAQAREQAVALAQGRPRKALEALLLAGEGTLNALSAWLERPETQPAGDELALADALSAKTAVAEMNFAREMIDAWILAEAREAAARGPAARLRLASANELWEKAHTLFAEADSLNLDARQTLITVLDAIRDHAQRSALAPTGTQ